MSRPSDYDGRGYDPPFPTLADDNDMLVEENEKLRQRLAAAEAKKSVCFLPKDETMNEERMMKWFEFEHLPEHLKIVSIKCYELACSLCALVEPGPERTVALRKLLEAKDAAVRAKQAPGA